MYDVIIRKYLRHADGSKVLYEDPAKVNHERHAENLAAKNARDPGVQWVEVEDTSGRFKARAKIGSDGIVHESLESRRYRGRQKGQLRPSRRRRTRIIWVVLIAAFVFGLVLTLMQNR